MNTKSPLQLYIDQLNELDYSLDELISQFRKRMIVIANECYEAGRSAGKLGSEFALVEIQPPLKHQMAAEAIGKAHKCEHPDCEGSKHDTK